MLFTLLYVTFFTGLEMHKVLNCCVSILILTEKDI